MILWPEAAFAVGYLALLVGPAAQAWRLVRTRQTAGISPTWLVCFALGLALLQYALMARGQHAAVVWGNGLGLAVATINLGAYLMARRGEAR